MRSLLAASYLALATACGPSVHAGAPPSSQTTASLIGNGSQQDTADRGCNVVLRQAQAERAGDGGFVTDCSSGTCWAIVDGTVDVSAEAVLEELPVRIWYQGSSGAWQYAPTTPAPGAGEGFRRYAFQLASSTFTPGVERQIVDLIPYLQTPAGGRVFDHNALADPSANYEVGPNENWTVQPPDAPICPGPQPQGHAELDFPVSWQNAQQGALVESGKLDIVYDPNRLPLCLGSNYNGFPTWATIAFVQFDQAPPLQYVLPAYQDGASWTAWPIETDIPAGAQRVALWYMQTGDECVGPSWDSNYGQNFVYPIAAQPPPRVGWAGNWGGSFDGSCTHEDGLTEPVDLGAAQLAESCLFVDAEVWVPGLTDQAALHPELIQAQVTSTLDDAAPVTSWLAFVGQVGNNYRYRWTLQPSALGASWSVDQYHFTFSTDGNYLYQIGEQDGPTGGPDRVLTHVP
ncbi:MAG TPA: DUF6209 family protein [Myxococcales bacterium]|nr:DUF6209 family protein [Myxococcales bacterium]